MEKFKYCVFIGRFQPFHLGHLKIVNEALKRAEHLVIVIGSAYSAKSAKNPWAASLREDMIRNSLSNEELDRVSFIYAQDYLYNDNLWIAELQQKVFEVVGDENRVALIGHEHDRTSYYMKLFPQWQVINLPNYDEFPPATDLRHMIAYWDPEYEDYVHKNVFSMIEEQRKCGDLDFLKAELDYIIKYKKSWEKAPFPPIFVTTDCVVIKSGHILVVKRKSFPGKGQLALPGGFLKSDEKIVVGAIRELKEETSIALSKEDLNKAIVAEKVFDHPDRSLRGRTITHAFLLDLKHGPLPKVKGSDYAERSWWMSLSDFQRNENQFFEDHWHIIHHFVSKY
jgi:bifunctional NMN adenylyltransferase/nudix hydrolase